MSLRFEFPEALWGMVPVIALLALMVWQGRRRGGFSLRRLLVAALGFTACVLGLARPQGGHYATTTQRGLRGDLYVAVDISNSMRVEDISPSRLEFTTSFVKKLLRAVPGLRVAIFPFAGDGYLQMPLSTDQDAASDLVGALTPSVTTNQGTEFGPSLETLLSAILKEKLAAADSSPTRVLLLSDGETHSGVPNAVLEKFRGRGIPIDTVGVGTQEGGLIPVESRNGFGREMLKDEQGRPVRSRMESKHLKQIAESTGGSYYGPRFEEVSQVAGRIVQGMEFGKLTTTFKLENDFYPFCFLAALGLFCIEFLCGRWEYLVRGAAALLLLLLPARSLALEPEVEARLSRAGRERPYTAFNLGVEMAKKGNLNDAAELFAESAGTTKDERLRKRALYDLGNALVKLQDPTQALAAYQKAYDAASDDKALNHDISHNMLVAKKMKAEQQKKQQEAQQDGDGEGDPNQPPPDPGKARQFKGEQFDEGQKQRMFDLVNDEEQQVLQRLQKGKNAKNANESGGKTW